MLDLIFLTLQIFMLLVLVLGIVWVLGDVLRDTIRKSLDAGATAPPDQPTSTPITLPDAPKPPLPSSASDRPELKAGHLAETMRRRSAEAHDRQR